jgi:hypothetical protein
MCNPVGAPHLRRAACKVCRDKVLSLQTTKLNAPNIRIPSEHLLKLSRRGPFKLELKLLQSQRKSTAHYISNRWWQEYLTKTAGASLRGNRCKYISDHYYLKDIISISSP